MSQLKNELAFCFGDSTKKGGNGMDENTTVTTEQIDTVPEAFEDETQPAAEGEPAPAEEGEVSPAEEGQNDGNQTPAEVSAEGSEDISVDEDPEAPGATEGEPIEQFSSTYRDKREAIEKALPCEHEADENGRIIRDVWYWICDFDDTHVFVEKSEYTQENGCSETKGRFAYTYDEDTRSATIDGDIEEMFVKWLTREELAQIEDQRAQYEELVAYKQMRVQKDHEAAIDVAISEFADLALEICLHYNLKCVDVRRSGLELSMLPDTLHPNAEGMECIFKSVLNKLKEEN
jgi:hypothetical protein